MFLYEQKKLWLMRLITINRLTAQVYRYANTTYLLSGLVLADLIDVGIRGIKQLILIAEEKHSVSDVLCFMMTEKHLLVIIFQISPLCDRTEYDVVLVGETSSLV